jgi:hypothetical protein
MDSDLSDRMSAYCPKYSIAVHLLPARSPHQTNVRLIVSPSQSRPEEIHPFLPFTPSAPTLRQSQNCTPNYSQGTSPPLGTPDERADTA